MSVKGQPMQINPQLIFNALGITREQFSQFSPQERQNAGNKYMQMLQQQQQQRPPSAFKPQQMTMHLQQSNPYPQSDNPIMDSPVPFRGAKRKATGDPMMALPPSPGGMMGPPGLPRSISTDNLMQQAQSPRPASSMGMNLGIMTPQRQTSVPPHGIKPASPMTMSASSSMGSTPAIAGPSSLPPSTPTPAPSSSVTPANAPTPALLPPTTSSALAPLPPLPANASLSHSITRVTPVPLLNSLTTIPTLSQTELTQIQGWVGRDKAYESSFRSMKERMADEIRGAFGGPGGLTANTGPFGTAVGWWEKPGTGNWNRWRRAREGFEIRYPKTKRERDREIANARGRRGILRREGLKLPRTIDPEDADRPELLVPIRIEFDVEHHKMRDTFVWNLNDPIVTPEIFAQSLVEDYALAPTYHSAIVKSIQDQLSDYKAHHLGFDLDSGSVVDIQDETMCGKLEAGDSKWWNGWRRKVKSEIAPRAVKDMRAVIRAHRQRQLEEEDEDEDEEEEGRTRRIRVKVKPVVVKKEVEEDGDVAMHGGDEMDDHDQDHEDYRSMGVDEFMVDEGTMHEDMRILIKLDIIVASIKLDDQFEWDLDNPSASPEDFAEVYTQELGLGGEFKTAIAHSIREQVQTYQKSLFLVGHPSDGSPVQDDDLKQSFLPSLTSGARPVGEVGMFTPLLNYLSDGELERTEKDRDKDLAKRRKRNTRGRRGVALPDREPIRTYRTPAIGFPELDAATLALAAAANAPVSRRAAAAAASLTIANMVASENGTAAFMPTAMMPTTSSSAQAQAKEKEKKPKGLFKAPVYPTSVLRPRASVIAPTPSTTADPSSLPPLRDGEAHRSSSSPAPTYISAHPLAHSHSGSGSASMGGVAGPGAGSSSYLSSKAISAKRAKELEREAKEKEFVEGQHPNFIEGVWHCSNCGCPESIAIGRRKGPLGDKSQCGTCGKYWHRHRRPRPVEYNADLNFHSGLKVKETESKTPSSKKKGGAAAAAALRAAAHSATPSEAPTPAGMGMKGGGGGGDAEGATTMASHKMEDEDSRALSPVSTASSASEAPLAQKVKTNGHVKSASGGVPLFTVKTEKDKDKDRQREREREREKEREKDKDKEKEKSDAPKSSSAVDSASAGSAGAAPTTTISTSSSGAPLSPSKTWPPPWLTGAMQAMQAKYPNDRFEAILRKVNASSTPEWRIKCLDCPGKLYTPGPNETLANYDVHLKNRLHRQRVNERISGRAVSHPPVSSGHASGGGAGTSASASMAGPTTTTTTTTVAVKPPPES